jgi:hypothetical protein
MTAEALLRPVARASLLPRSLSRMAARTAASMTRRKPPATQITHSVNAVNAIDRSVLDVDSSALRAISCTVT